MSGLECRSLNREVLDSNPNGAVLNLGKVCLPHALPKSLGILLVYLKRMAVGVKPKEGGSKNKNSSKN